jgi:hypothetical protein
VIIGGSAGCYKKLPIKYFIFGKMSKARIDSFDGTGDVDSWIRRFNIVVECNADLWSKGAEGQEAAEKMINRRAGIEIKLALVGNMADWVDTLEKEKWDKFTLVLDALRKHLQGTDFERDQMPMAIACKREDCSTEAEYYAKKVKLMKIAFEGYKADVTPLKIDLFIDGLKPNIRGWILKEPIGQRDSLEKIHTLAQQFEKLFAIAEDKDEVNALTDKKKPYIQTPNKSGGRRFCAYCGNLGHLGVWDPLCPQNDPNFKRPEKPYKKNYYNKDKKNGSYDQKQDRTEDKKNDRKRDDSKFKCFTCGEVGHMAFNCPKNQKN